jgi:tetratricopeptide (TPR) repeat protein
MKTTRLFLASSSELMDDRKEFEIFIQRKNKDWYKKGIFIELIIWEDFLEPVAQTRLQNEYNKEIAGCDLFVMLYFTKVGKFSEEEFDVAYEQFKSSGKPLIYPYFKEVDKATVADNPDDFKSLCAFQEKLQKLGDYQRVYKNIDELKFKFNQQLDKLFDSGFIKSDQSGAIPKLLTEPPFMPEIFLGRESDLLAIKAKLFSGDNLLLLVNGNGGVGKTSLAAKYYDLFKDEYAHVAWVLSQKSIGNALLTLAGPLKLAFDQNMPSEERLKVLLKAMASLDKPCLLVIDNANEIEDLKQNYQSLRRCTNFHLLITSRINHFEQAESYHIDGLPYDRALELFKKYYPKHTKTENSLFEQIHTAIGGNTLVVELLAKYLKIVNTYKANYTLNDLLTDLRTKGLLGLPTTKTVATDYQANQGTMLEEKPEAIVAAMYDLSELTNPEKDLLFLFAILPAEAIDYAMIEQLTANDLELDDNLETLVQKGFIERNTNMGELKCNPLIQEIARKKHPKNPDECRIIINILTEKLAYDGIALVNSNYQNAEVFAKYAESVVRNFDVPNRSLAILCDRLGNYYLNIGYFDAAMIFFNSESNSFLRLYEANPRSESLKNGLAISYEKLGSIHQSMGNMEEALKYFDDYNRLSKGLYEANPRSEELKNGLAISYSKLGDIHESMGHMEEALKYFELFSKIFKEHYEANPRSEGMKNGLAISYSKLGSIHQSMGHMEEALKYFELRSVLGKELYEANPRSESLKNGLAISYSKLGNIHQSMGHMEEALKYFENDLALTKELYEANPRSESLKNGLANSFGMTGDLFIEMGKMDEGIKNIEKATELFKELYEANPRSESLKNGLAISYSKLGSIHQSMGQMEEALKYFDDEVKLFKELYEANPCSESLKNGLAISYSKLGDIHQSMGHMEEALKYFDLRYKYSKELYEANPRSESLKNGLAISYEKLGDIHRSMGHMEEAFKYFEMRSVLGKELYEANPRSISLLEGLGISYYQLAMLYKAVGNNTIGRDRFAEWKKIISFLAANLPQVQKYRDWDKAEY